MCNHRNERRRNILIISFIPLANVIISSLWFTIRFSLDQLMITYKESNKWWQIQKLQLQKLSISNEKIEMILLQMYFSSLYSFKVCYPKKFASWKLFWVSTKPTTLERSWKSWLCSIIIKLSLSWNISFTWCNIQI